MDLQGDKPVEFPAQRLLIQLLVWEDSAVTLSVSYIDGRSPATLQLTAPRGKCMLGLSTDKERDTEETSQRSLREQSAVLQQHGCWLVFASGHVSFGAGLAVAKNNAPTLDVGSEPLKVILLGHASLLASSWNHDNLQRGTPQNSDASEIWEGLDKSDLKLLLERARPHSTSMAVQVDADVAVSLSRVDTTILEAENDITLEAALPDGVSNEERLTIKLPQNTWAFQRAREKGKSVDVLMVHVAPKAAATEHKELDVEGDRSLASGLYSVAVRVDGESIDSIFDAAVPWTQNHRVRSFGSGKHEFACATVSARNNCRAVRWDENGLSCSCAGKSARFASVWEGPRIVGARRLVEAAAPAAVNLALAIDVPGSFMFPFPDAGHYAAVAVPILGIVLMVLAALYHRRNRKATDLALFCVASEVPPLKPTDIFARPLDTVRWIFSPRTDSDFPASMVLKRLRLARRRRRSKGEVDYSSIFAFLVSQEGCFGMFGRVLYRDYPLSCLWISFPWCTNFALVLKFVSTLCLTLGCAALRYVLSDQNLPKILDELDHRGLTMPDMHNKIYDYSITSERFTDVVFLTFVCKASSFAFGIGLTSLFRRLPVTMSPCSPAAVAQQTRTWKQRQRLGFVGCIMAYVLFSITFVGACYGLVSKLAARELLTSLAIAVGLKFIIVPLLTASLSTFILIQARTTEAYDGILTLNPRMMSFLHEVFKKDTTGHLRAFLRDIGVEGHGLHPHMRSRSTLFDRKNDRDVTSHDPILPGDPFSPEISAGLPSDHHWMKKASGHIGRTSTCDTVETLSRSRLFSKASQPGTPKSLGTTTTSGSTMIEMTPVSTPLC
jgi:hypothetical protein